MTITDALGREMTIPRVPRRIVSLVPSLTELLADLGLEDAVIGVTRFCIRPEVWKETKQVVGGTKNVNLDRVNSLAPDLVLANLEENTRTDVEALHRIAPVYVTDVANLSDAISMIRAIGALTGTLEQAAGMADEIDAAFRKLPAFEPLQAVYLIWREPYMTVGGDTFIHDLMQRAGFVNPFVADRRYPETSLAEVAELRPDLLLLSTEPFPFRQEHAEELSAALPDVRVRIVDGQMFSWYGSRLLEAPAYFRQIRV